MATETDLCEQTEWSSQIHHRCATKVQNSSLRSLLPYGSSSVSKRSFFSLPTGLYPDKIRLSASYLLHSEQTEKRPKTKVDCIYPILRYFMNESKMTI